MNQVDSRWWNHPAAALRYGVAMLTVGAALTEEVLHDAQGQLRIA